MDKKIKMGFPRSEALRFARAVHAGHTNVEEFVEHNVNLGKAEATVEADLHTIRAKISESLGETAFNEALQYD